MSRPKRQDLEKLDSRRRRFVEHRVAGKSVQAAAQATGISNSSAYGYNREEDVQKAYRYLMQKAMSPHRLVGLITRGCIAKMPTYSSDGKKHGERPDWKTRRPYIEMAAKHAGYYEEKGEAAGTQIVIQVAHIGQAHAKVQAHVLEPGDDS